MRTKRKLTLLSQRISKVRPDSKRVNHGSPANQKRKLKKGNKEPKILNPIRIETLGIDYDFKQEDVRVHRDLVRESINRRKHSGDDENRMKLLLLAIEFEIMASAQADLMVENVRIYEWSQDDLENYQTELIVKNDRIFDRNQNHKLFSFVLHKEKMYEKLKDDENSTILLTSGRASAPNLHIATVQCMQTMDKTEVIFDLSPYEPPLKMYDRYNIRVIEKDFSLSWGYKALITLEAKSLGLFFTSFESSCKDSIDFSKQPEQQNEDASREDFDWANLNVAQNEEQKLAIKNIVNSSAKPYPFIVFGPPGTGKTTVLVEAVVQLLKQTQNDKILITSQSNSACYDICFRLMRYVEQDQIFRFYSAKILSAHWEDNSKVPESLVHISNIPHPPSRSTQGSSMNQLPRVTIATLTASALLNKEHFEVNSRMHKNFNHIFIDECASATEPNSLIPFGNFGFNHNDGKFILLGDHKQLGPVVKSQISEKLGLGVSLMERMMTKERYQAKPNYNNNYVVQLLDNYRSHPAILHFSNTEFYRGQLRAKMPFKDHEWAQGCSVLKNKSFPVAFHSVYKASQVDNNFSSYNLEQVKMVASYVAILLHDGIAGRALSSEDIGVVTPYNAQINRLKTALRGMKIDIGTAEYFQGREKNIMIMSTVKSQKTSIGFLKNVKRLNVMMTRARHLLIIIGNPETLSMNRNWSSLIDYCRKNNAMFEKDWKTETLKAGRFEEPPRKKFRTH